MDRASVIGILIGTGAVVAGNFLDGGRVDSILQPTAALIVFGGTAGATLLNFPFSDSKRAFSSLGAVFFGGLPDPEPLIQDLIRCSFVARKKGFVALDPELTGIAHSFPQRALQMACYHRMKGVPPWL